MNVYIYNCNCLYSSDGSSGHIFTTAVAVVEVFITALAVAVFGCVTTAVAVVTNIKINSTNN